ncbi:MAG TPA: hypothetical protein VGD98_22610 [Ktedonobacteraceae bacterium]
MIKLLELMQSASQLFLHSSGTTANNRSDLACTQSSRETQGEQFAFRRVQPRQVPL